MKYINNYLKKIIIVLLIVFILCLFLYKKGTKVMAETDYSSVTLTELYNIRNNATLMNKVKRVEITENDDYNNISLISNCNNLNYIMIYNLVINDASIFNNLKGNNITLNFMYSIINFNNINSSKITRLFIDESTMSNYSKVINITNLTEIHIESVQNYENIDYSKLTKLTYLSLKDEKIGDYSIFSNYVSKSNISSLVLSGSDVKSSDLINLSKLNKVTSLSLGDTYVDDLTELTNMANLQSLGLPMGISNFQPIYNMKSLKELWWDGGITEYNISGNSSFINYLNNKNISHTPVNPNYNVKNKIDEIISSLNLKSNATDFEKVHAVTRYVVNNMTYDDNYYPDSPYRTSLEQSLFGKYGVCHDYSTLEYTLLKKLGIEVYRVIGSSVNFYDDDAFLSKNYGSYRIRSHAWNNVRIDGKWYLIDATWVNPSISNTYATYVLRIIDPNDIDYDSEIDKIHVSYNQPKCVFSNICNEPIGMVFRDEFIVKSENEKVIPKIMIDTTVKEFLSTFVIYNGTKKIYDANNNLLSDNSKITTNSKLIIETDGKTYSYNLSVLGDLTGDGKVDINDLKKLYNHMYQSDDEYKMIKNSAEYEAGLLTNYSVSYFDVAELYRRVKENE